MWLEHSQADKFKQSADKITGDSFERFEQIYPHPSCDFLTFILVFTMNRAYKMGGQ